MSKIEAVCSFIPSKQHPNVTGYVEFVEGEDGVLVYVNVKGLPPGMHGIHIHNSGDLRDGCKSLCSHFNPTNKTHGNRGDKIRHVGDLGNIKVGRNGSCICSFTDKIIKLKGKNSIIGRSVVIHKNQDDLGKGGLDKNGNIVDKKVHDESLKTGNAGARLAGAVIGYSKNMC